MSSVTKSEHPGIDWDELRDTLYYGKYAYRVELVSPGIRIARFARNLPDLLIFMSFGRRRYLTKQDTNDVNNNQTSIANYYEWVAANEPKFADKTLKMIRGDGNKIIVFSNELETLKDFEAQFVHPQGVRYSRARCGWPDTKYFSNPPKHRYRVYMRTRYISIEQREEIIKFVTQNSTSLILSPTFRRWVYGPHPHYKHRMLSKSYFIDYDREYMTSHIILSIGEFTHRRYQLLHNPTLTKTIEINTPSAEYSHGQDS